MRYRSNCQNLVFQDFAFAAEHAVEDVLWETHSLLNNQFRKRLSYVSLTIVMALATTLTSSPSFERHTEGESL